jgi:hypothetical protein
MAFDITLPSDLIQFWEETSSVHLFEEINYGQWGLVIWSPEEVLTKHPERFQERAYSEDFRKGDLIIGSFLGDLDMPVGPGNSVDG